MGAPLFTNRMIAVNPDRTWSFESLQKFQQLFTLLGGDTGSIPATRVTFSPTGSLSSTDMQAVAAELDADLTAHTGNTSNPHAVTKTQVGLGNVDNTSDANKPVSTAQAAADAAVQAFAIQRANHTGTQTAATISDFSAAADARVAAAVGVSVQAYDADLTAWAGKTAPSGVAVGTTDTQTLSNKTLATPVVTGTEYTQQGAVTSKGAAATLTIAELLTRIIQYTGAADTLTLPTGANIEAGVMAGLAVDRAFEFNVINTGSGTATIATAAGLTLVGTMTVAAGASGAFRVRKTATDTYTVYRIA